MKSQRNRFATIHKIVSTLLGIDGVYLVECTQSDENRLIYIDLFPHRHVVGVALLSTHHPSLKPFLWICSLCLVQKTKSLYLQIWHFYWEKEGIFKCLPLLHTERNFPKFVIREIRLILKSARGTPHVVTVTKFKLFALNSVKNHLFILCNYLIRECIIESSNLERKSRKILSKTARCQTFHT